MIIAKVGHQQYALKSIQQAESLLSILSEATPIDNTYVGGDYKTVYYKDSNAANIEITVDGQTEIMEKAEAMALKETRSIEESDSAS